MKNKLNIFYHRYFVEIQTAVLVLLFANLLLLSYGIVNANKQRQSARELQLKTLEKQEEIRSVQDSTYLESAERLDNLLNKIK
ncbi:MAG: hypothetical protein ACRC8Z_04990 [Empedobacter falsenii]